LNDIKEAEPKYFSLANFQCRRFKTNQLLASMNYEAINWLKKSTIYFKNDNSFWLVKKDNGIEKINQGEILISLELD
jgi:hypothetical protein